MVPVIYFLYHLKALAQYFNLDRQTRTRISPVTSVAGFFFITVTPGLTRSAHIKKGIFTKIASPSSS
jgi:hypothetical protein